MEEKNEGGDGVEWPSLVSDDAGEAGEGSSSDEKSILELDSKSENEEVVVPASVVLGSGRPVLRRLRINDMPSLAFSALFSNLAAPQVSILPRTRLLNAVSPPN